MMRLNIFYCVLTKGLDTSYNSIRKSLPANLMQYDKQNQTLVHLSNIYQTSKMENYQNVL